MSPASSPLAQDALVIGAGIVGAACAEALARAGARVVVLDAGRPAGAATAAGMGHVLVLDDSEAQLALTKRSRELWDLRAAEWPAAVEREVTGTLWVAADDEELAVVHAKRAWYAQRGVEASALDGRELLHLEPNLRSGLAGALLVPGDSVVYPPAAARHLLETAVHAGARVQCGRAVRAVGDGWVVLGDGARLEADLVVVAAGVAAPSLLAPSLLMPSPLMPSPLMPSPLMPSPLASPSLAVVPKKGHLVITDRAPGFVRHQLVELGYLASAHGGDATSVAFNVQPRATGQVLVGSSRQLGITDARVEREVVARMVRRALEFMPRLGALPVVRTWVGFRPATADNLPIIGPLPAAPRTFLATGHEGVGITTSLGTAELVVDLAAGRVPALDPAPFSPARFAREEVARA